MCSNMWADAANADALVLGSDVIEDLHGRDRRLVIGQEQHVEAVRERPVLDVQLRRGERGRRRGRRVRRLGRWRAVRDVKQSGRERQQHQQQQSPTEHDAREYGIETAKRKSSTLAACGASWFPGSWRPTQARRPSRRAPRRSRPSRSRSRRTRVRARPGASGSCATAATRSNRAAAPAARGYARDSQAGCHLPGDVAAVFAKLAAIAGDGLTRENAGPAAAPAAGRAPSGLLPGGAQTRVVLVRPDGSRWIGREQGHRRPAARRGQRAADENQWYATPPAKPIGAGAQLVVLAVATSDGGGSKRTEASLASDGRWWCYRSVVGARGGEEKLPARRRRR